MPEAFTSGTRATTAGPGPQQMGGFAGTQGLAPWLTQGTGALMPMRTSAPQLGGGQVEKLAQQRALADQLRAAPVKDFDLWKNPTGTFGDVPAYAPPPPVSNDPFSGSQLQVGGYGPDEVPQYAPSGGHMDYSGDVPTFVQDAVNPTDPYGWGPDFSDYYNKAHGAGSLDAEGKRYAGLDASDQLGDYESLYGEFPEADPAAMEEWFRRANMGGQQTANQQDMVAQNKRTELTEAGIMAALSMGMGYLTGPAAAASMAGAAEEAAMLGIGNAYSGAAGGGFSLGSMAPTVGGLANTGIQAAYQYPYYNDGGGY